MSFIPNLTYSIASSVWSGTTAAMGKGMRPQSNPATTTTVAAATVNSGHTNNHHSHHHRHHHHHHSHSHSGSIPSSSIPGGPAMNGNRRYSQTRRQSNSTYTFSRSHHHHHPNAPSSSSSSSSSSSTSSNPLTPPHSPNHYSQGAPDRKPTRKRNPSISSMPRTPPSSPQPDFASTFDHPQQQPQQHRPSSTQTFSRKKAFAESNHSGTTSQEKSSRGPKGGSPGTTPSPASSRRGQTEPVKAPTTPEERYQVVDSILETENLYKVLAVNRNATSEEIRRAYIAKSRVCHPDKFPEYPRATEAFQKLSLAYETLSKPSSRFVYDSTGGSTGRSMLGSDETLQSVLAQVFFEFMDGDFEVIRNMINTMNNTTGGVRLGDDVIVVIEEMFLRLRFVLHGCKKYMTLVHDQVQQLSEIHHSMRSLAYLDVLGRFRLTLKLSKVMLTIPMIIQDEMRREIAVAAALEGGTDSEEKKKNAGIVGTVFLNDRVETVLKKVVSAIETGERWNEANMLALRTSSTTKPRSAPQQKLKGSTAQRDNGHDEEEDLIEQLNRKLSNVTLNPTTSIPDEMNISDISTMTIWALGNISGDGPPYRDLILRSGALDVILSLIEMCDDPSVAKEQKYMILRIAVWCVSNLCRGSGRAAPEWLQVTPAFSMLRRLMYIDDTEILADTCWALCRILNGTHKMNLEAVVIDRELCARFVALLSEPHPTIQVPSLRSLINIASGPEHHTQLLIDALAIPVLGSQELLVHRNSTIRRDALLGISNITAGTADQVREVTVQDNGNVMRRVLDILRRGDVGGEELSEDGEPQEEGGDWRVLREAAWVVSNATSVLDLEITGHLVYRLDLLPSIAQLIDPRRSRKANYVLPAIGLAHPPLLTKLLDIVFNVLRCNEHHPKEQFMKIWVNDCEGGSILLELLKLSGSGNDVQSRHLDNRKLVPRPLQHLRFAQNENGILTAGTKQQQQQSSSQQVHPPLGPSVKKRVETILENFFEFGPENDGFGPFFSERQGTNRPLHEGYGSDYHDDDDDEDDDYDFNPKVYYGEEEGHTEDVDFDIDDMEERVGRMNLA
ncbi:hypothetical protein BG004_005427 [Podila humilis]|nr:hypothetical protein BG004_005427 [Podila humilis]